MEIANLIVQLVYDYLILHYFGVKAFVYLFGGFMVCFHLARHFSIISNDEHSKGVVQFQKV